MTYLQQNQGPRIVVINIVTLIVAVIAVTLRLISRRLSAAHFWWDDGLIILGLVLDFGSSAFNFIAARNGAGRHQEAVPAAQLVTLEQVIYGIEILYGPLLTAIKSSILMLYLRLFGVRKAFRISIYALETLVICWCLSIFFASIFQSSPPSYIWKQDMPNAHHINFPSYLLGLAIPNVVMDFAILVLPLSIVWQLQISRRRKMALSAIFLVGTFVCVVSIIRAHAIAVVNNSDKSFSNASTLIWSTVEANVGITCACLPIMQPVVQKLAGKLMDSETSNSGKDVPRALQGRNSSHETFESSSRPFRRLDEDVISVPSRAVPANSTWISAGEGFASYGYHEDDDETSGIPMNAIRVKNDVDLKCDGQA